MTNAREGEDKKTNENCKKKERTIIHKTKAIKQNNKTNMIRKKGKENERKRRKDYEDPTRRRQRAGQEEEK